MMHNSFEKVLKYIIWTGLVAVCFTPLVIHSGFYFPFIVPKTVFFKVIVSIIFLAYLILAVSNEKYRGKLNLVLVLFSVYIAIISLSSLINGSFYFSFWSNNERSEGILLLFFLFLFLIVLNGFLNSGEENEKLGNSSKWLVIFDTSFLSGLLISLYSLGQYFGLRGFIDSSGGARLTATIGNAGYVAGYLIFNIFFGLFLFFFRKNKALRWYYGIGIFLQIFVTLNTLTRGAIIALVFSLLILLGYLFFVRFRKNKLFRNAAIVSLILAVVFTGIIFVNKDADWVRQNDVLERITSISTQATTAQNRLMTWESAFKGFKEKPILGYGYENFYQVFDKYFNPKIYRKARSVVWFDRAHNIIFDRLISGGIIGLLLYMSMLFLPLLYLWKRFYREKKEYLVPLFFSLIIISYFIQNFFIFEALVTYIPLFITLAFLSHYCPSWKDNLFQSSSPYVVSLTFWIIAFIPFLFIFTIKPAATNMQFIDALILSQYSNQAEETYNAYVELFKERSLGSQEYRQHFGEFASIVAANENIPSEKQSMVALTAEQEFDKQIAEKPGNARNYLMFMRFLNKTYQFNVERLNKSIELFKKGSALNPTKPHFYYEVAYSQIYLGRYYQEKGKTEESEQLFDQAIANMDKALSLNDQVVESYLNAIMAHFATNRIEGVQKYLDIMEEKGLDYHDVDSLKRLADVTVTAKAYDWSARFYGELAERNPDIPEIWVNLALSYAYAGNKEKAIETAKEIAKFGGEYIEESEKFIQSVLNGVFDQ